MRRLKVAGMGVLAFLAGLFYLVWAPLTGAGGGEKPVATADWGFWGIHSVVDGAGLWVAVFLCAGLVGLVGYLWREMRRLQHCQFDLAKLSLVANRTDNAVIVLRRDGMIDWVNEGFSRVTGLTLTEVQGLELGPLLVGERGSDRSLQSLRDAVKQRKNTVVEVQGSNKHGSVYWLSLSLAPIFDERKRLVYYVGVGSNLTARRKAEEALARMSRWYELMLNAMKDGICGVDLNGNITFLNPAVTGLTGWKAGELIGQSVGQLLHQVQVNAMPDVESDQFLSIVFKDNTVMMGDENFFRRKDGVVFPVEYTSTPVREGDQLVGFVVVFRDLTERRQTEIARGRQARQFALRAEIGFCLATSDSLRGFLDRSAQALLRHLDGGLARIWLFQASENVLELQASAGATTRLDGPESRLSMGAYAVGRIAREGRPEVIQNLGEDDTELGAEWMAHERLVSLVGFPLVVENRLLAMVGVYSKKPFGDDTLDLLGSLADSIGQGLVRKRAEEKVAEQAALLDKSQDAILVIDLAQGCQYWNKSAERLYGWPARDVLGKRVDQLIYANPSDFFRARAELMDKGELKEEAKQVTRDGRTVVVESHWTLVQDKQGQPQSILLVNTDVTEKKQMEGKFLRAQRMESLGALAGGIAHDLNNILAPILMSVEVLKDRFTDEASQRLLWMAESSAKRGADMVKQVLSFSKGMDSERVVLQPRHLIKEINRIVTETFPKTIRFRTQFSDTLWSLTGDATQLHQVLVNLVVNARDAMPDGGLLTLTAENEVLEDCPVPDVPHFKPGSYVVIKVSDTGTGIPREHLERIFEPFFTTKESGHGTGLGLSTVVGIVKNHGGFLRVTTEPNRGTTFEVYLPASENTERQVIELTPTRLATGNGEWILVVDDEASVLTMTKEMLETYGYHVLTAHDGTEAVSVYTEHRRKIAAVLTDMIMPYMDGPATIRALKRIDPGVRVIAASGLLDAEKVRNTTGLNQIAFLMKPYTAEKLLNAVSQALHETQAGSRLSRAA